MITTHTPSLVDLKTEGGIATLTLNRPDKRNAFTDAMRNEFIAALEHVADNHDNQAVSAVVRAVDAGRGDLAVAAMH